MATGGPGSEGKHYKDLYGNPDNKQSKDIYTQKFSIKNPYFVVLATFSLCAVTVFARSTVH